MREEIEKSGGKIITEARVQKITETSDGKVTVEAGEHTGTFDKVVATTPTHVFADLIRDNKSASEKYLKRLKSIDYIGTVVMVFTSDQEISPYYWHNINDPDIPFLVFLSNTVLAGKDVYQGKNVYYIGFYADHDHHYFRDDEKQIMNEWQNGLKQIFPDFDASAIREKRLFKFKNAQHIVDIGYEQKIPSYKSDIPNVYLANFSQIYPDDRGLNYAIREGGRIAKLIIEEKV